jgi:hypothetical protein
MDLAWSWNRLLSQASSVSAAVLFPALLQAVSGPFMALARFWHSIYAQSFIKPDFTSSLLTSQVFHKVGNLETSIGSLPWYLTAALVRRGYLERLCASDRCRT